MKSIDTISDGGIVDSNIFFKRSEKEIIEKLRESSICDVALHTYKIKKLWHRLSNVTDFSDPYAYFAHTHGFKKDLVRQYCRIGKVIEKYSNDLSDIDLKAIRSPYHLLHFGKMVKLSLKYPHQYPMEAILKALTELSYRKFVEYAKGPEAKKQNKKDKVHSTPIISREELEGYRETLHNYFMLGFDVYIVPSNDKEHESRILSAIESKLHPVNHQHEPLSASVHNVA